MCLHDGDIILGIPKYAVSACFERSPDFRTCHAYLGGASSEGRWRMMRRRVGWWLNVSNVEGTSEAWHGRRVFQIDLLSERENILRGREGWPCHTNMNHASLVAMTTTTAAAKACENASQDIQHVQHNDTIKRDTTQFADRTSRQKAPTHARVHNKPHAQAAPRGGSRSRRAGRQGEVRRFGVSNYVFASRRALQRACMRAMLRRHWLAARGALELAESRGDTGAARKSGACLGLPALHVPVRSAQHQFLLFFGFSRLTCWRTCESDFLWRLEIYRQGVMDRACF